MKAVAKAPDIKKLQGKHARGVVKAKILLPAEVDFVSEGVDYSYSENGLSLYAYTGPEEDPEFYIIFELEQQDGMRDVVIDDKRNRVYVHKRGATFGGYARSGIIKNLVTTSTSAKAESFTFEGEDDFQRKFSATGESFDVYAIVPT